MPAAYNNTSRDKKLDIAKDNLWNKTFENDWIFFITLFLLDLSSFSSLYPFSLWAGADA